MKTVVSSSPDFKPKLVVRRLQSGSWWWFGIVDVADGYRTWAPITSLANTPDTKEALRCYWLAWWYFKAGILGKLMQKGMRENGERAEAVEFPDGDTGDR